MPDLVWKEQLELIVRLLIAGICGFVIGQERKNRNKEAGIRTHIIVAVASCLMMEISKYGFSDSGDFDGARLAAQVVSGIGFLGAGMIFVHKNSVKGLTTAAGVWATSGIGMAIGAGMYVIGIATTIIIYLFQILFHMDFEFLRHQNSENIIFVLADTPDSIEHIKEMLAGEGLSYGNISFKKLANGEIEIEISTNIPENFDMLDFVKKAAEDSLIKSVYSE